MIQIRTSACLEVSLSNTPHETMTLIGQRLRVLQASRKGVVLGLWGDPGIGKTWLLERILQSPGFRHVTVNSNLAISDLIRLLPRPKRLPGWVEHSLERVARDEYLPTSSLADVLGAFLSALAPMILCFEDLHDASNERLELITALAKLVLRTRGVALIVTSRNLPPAPFETFKLEAISIEASKTLLGTNIKANLPEPASAWIYARAAGNPLFTLEFLRFLTRGGFVWNDGNHWRWRTPPSDLMPVTVEALIERLLDQSLHSDVLQNALEAKALLGLGATQSLWAEVAGLSVGALLAAQHELEQHNLLVNLECAHPLFAEVTLKRLTLERRQVLARRALAALRDEPIAAAQFVEAANLEPEMVLEWLKRAAELAKAQGNEVQAAQFQARATAYATGEERGYLALEAAKGLMNHPEKIRLAQMGLKELPGNVEIIFLLAEEYTWSQQLNEMNRVLELLPEHARNGEAWLERLFHLLGNLSDSAAVLKLWHEHPEMHQTTDGRILLFVSMALASYGKHEDANTLIDQALTNPDLRLYDRGLLLNGKGVDLLQGSSFEKSEKVFSQAIDLLFQTKNLTSVISPLLNRSFARHMLGLYQASLEDLNQAEQLSLDSGDAPQLAAMQMFKANVLIELGDYEQAEELLLEAQKVMQWESIPVHLADCEDTISRLYHDWQPPHGSVLSLKYAHASLDHARAVGRPRQLADKLHLASLAETRFGNPARGLELAKEALELSANPDLLEQHCTAHFAYGLALERLGKKQEAIQALQHALELAERLGLVLVTHKMGLELDRLTQNLENVRLRLAWFEKRGLQNGVNLARRYFPELAVLNRSTPLEPNTSGLRLEVLGNIQLRQNNTSKPIRGQKRKELLAYLLEARIAGRSEVRVFELLELLYPESSPEEAADALKQLVFQIRSSYGQSVIASTGNGYALGAIDSDAEDFLTQGDTQLWRGLYLQTDSQSRDENVREALYQALRSSLAKTLESNPKEAIRLGRILSDAEPYDLEVLSLSLQAFRFYGDHRGLSRFFAAGRARFLEIGEQLPENWQDFLTAQSA
jgi:tetratricopeptide (TPR) repeat protein